jgi:TolB protein
MIDLNDRFRTLDRLEPPDLWPDIERRELRHQIQLSRGRGRIAIVAVALAVSAVAIWLAAVAFRSNVRSVHPPPTTQPPGVTNGLIAYLGGGDLEAVFVINPDGTGRQRLTPGGMSSSKLSWSPDGRQILFDRGSEGEGEVVLMNADGSDLHVITSNPRLVYNGPVWSPDGTLIAFISGDANVDIMDADGSNVRRVLDNAPDCSPGNGVSWSPDSTRLVYVLECDPEKGRQSTAIEVIGVDGNGRKVLIGPIEVIPTNSAAGYSEPAWSPDGAHILFVETQDVASGVRSQIYVMNANGSNIQRLTPDQGDDWSPVWSPDGTRIAFLSGTGQVWVMNADGSDRMQVTHEPVGVMFAPAWQPIPPG